MATKGKKNAKVKWAIGASEPDDLPDFQSNDDIMRKNKGALPPKGRTRVLIKSVKSKDNKNGDQMLTVTCEIAETGSKKDQAFNGYAMWERLNVTEQGAPYLKRFLSAIGVKWNDFINKTVADESGEVTVINKIGSVKFGTDKPPVAWVSVKHGVDQNDEEQADVGRFLPPPDDDEDEDVDDSDNEDDEDDDEDIEVDDDDDDDDTDDDDGDEDDSDDEDDDDDDDDESDDDDDESELRAELRPLKVPALKKRAIRAGVEEDDLPSKKGDLIDAIVEAELGDDDDEDDDEDGEEPQDPDELKAELKGLDLTTLRNRARANGRKATDLKGAKKPALIKFIVEDEIPPF